MTEPSKEQMELIEEAAIEECKFYTLPSAGMSEVERNLDEESVYKRGSLFGFSLRDAELKARDEMIVALETNLKIREQELQSVINNSDESKWTYWRKRAGEMTDDWRDRGEEINSLKENIADLSEKTGMWQNEWALKEKEYLLLKEKLAKALIKLECIGHRTEPEEFNGDKTLGYLTCCEHVIEDANYFISQLKSDGENKGAV